MATKDDDGRTIVGDYSFPPGCDPDGDLTYTIPYGDSETKDLKWEGYIDVAHQLGAREVRKELVDAGVDGDGIKYAVVKTTVVGPEGNEFSAFGSADETTNQVRDPEFTWVVAESRSVKRAVKNAFNIVPVDSDASDEPDGRGERSPPEDIDFDDDHALSGGGSSRDSPEVDDADDW